MNDVHNPEYSVLLKVVLWLWGQRTHEPLDWLAGDVFACQAIHTPKGQRWGFSQRKKGPKRPRIASEELERFAGGVGQETGDIIRCNSTSDLFVRLPSWADRYL
jgi:hypothetical protein